MVLVFGLGFKISTVRAEFTYSASSTLKCFYLEEGASGKLTPHYYDTCCNSDLCEIYDAAGKRHEGVMSYDNGNDVACDVGQYGAAGIVPTNNASTSTSVKMLTGASSVSFIKEMVLRPNDALYILNPFKANSNALKQLNILLELSPSADFSTAKISNVTVYDSSGYKTNFDVTNKTVNYINNALGITTPVSVSMPKKTIFK